MSLMKSWLLAVTCATVIAAVAEALAPPGASKRLVRLASGLVMLLAVLGPVKQIDQLDLADLLAEYRAQRGSVEEAMASNEEMMKAIIAEQSAAYIEDKARSLGLEQVSVTVVCRMAEGGFPVPHQVRVRGAGSEEAWSSLSRAITADFAIGEENQTFERTDTP